MIDRRDTLAGAMALAPAPRTAVGAMPPSGGGLTPDWLDGVRTAHHLRFTLHHLRSMQAILASAEGEADARRRAQLWLHIAAMASSLQGSLRVVSAKGLHESRKAERAP